MSRDAAGTRPRLDGVAFWRGLLLCMIFVNHVPGNRLEPLTAKNFGFSDSAEGFVFISGVSLALAFGGKLADGDWAGVARKLFRRAWTLYGLHLALSVAGMAVFLLGASLGHAPDLLQVHGRDLLVRAPAEAVLGTLTLGHQFGYFNILPMYVLLLAFAPLLLLLARVGRGAMLASSLALYGLARVFGWNLPTWPEPGGWFFDPFTWQLLMAFGLAAGLAARHRAPRATNALIVPAAGIVVAGLVVVTNGFGHHPGLYDATRTWADLDKTTLGVGRLVHFAALAYLMHVFRVADRVRGTPLFGPLCTIGRNGMWAFGALSLLAAVGQVVIRLAGPSFLTDGVMMLAGLLALYAVAQMTEDRRQTSRPPVARPRVAARGAGEAPSRIPGAAAGVSGR